MQPPNFFQKKRIRIPPAFIPQTPPAGGKSAEAKRKIISPRKTDFRFAESVLKPHALPEYLEGRTPKKNVLSTFKRNFTPAKSKKQGTFFFGVAERSEAVAERYERTIQFQATTRSARAISHHHEFLIK